MKRKKQGMLSSKELGQFVSTDADALIARLKSSNLADGDRDLVIHLIGLVVTLRSMVESKSFALKALLRRLFGIKTEREPPSTSGDRDKSKSGKDEKPKGHGRNQQGDYPGAEHVFCKHETLAAGDTCPNCHVAMLSESDPGIAYRWKGQPPLVLAIFLLQRLICHNCKETFTAQVPGETPVDGERPKERRCDASANASVAMMRYEYGVPHYRLSQIQDGQGCPLPASNQWKMILAVYLVAEIIFRTLENIAAQLSLVQNDDTHIRVLTLERGEEMRCSGDKLHTNTIDASRAGPAPPKKNLSVKSRKGVTSGILSTGDGRAIALFYTGIVQGGEHLNELLRQRASDLSAPIQMCDALSGNLPKEFETIVANCMDHSRRKFYDVSFGFPDEVSFVLGKLRKVYEVDAHAKEEGMNAEARLAYHQAVSQGMMDEIYTWAKSQMESSLCRTSGLGKAIKYMLKHWQKLTLFLRVADAPLANIAVERLLKKAIRHRKNSLQYMNLRGARVGDTIMSLIQTCRLNGINPFDYLTTIQRHVASVQAEPEKWLPWNYAANLRPS